MKENINLTRYLEAHNQVYLKAFDELQNGKKQSHWMWYIFPQLKGLGRSDTAKFYGINDLEEAAAYLAHPVLGTHLREISEVLLTLATDSAHAVFGSPDDLKLRSSMTLFAQLAESGGVFLKVLDKFYGGKQDESTLQLLGISKEASDE